MTDPMTPSVEPRTPDPEMTANEASKHSGFYPAAIIERAAAGKPIAHLIVRYGDLRVTERAAQASDALDVLREYADHKPDCNLTLREEMAYSAKPYTEAEWAAVAEERCTCGLEEVLANPAAREHRAALVADGITSFTDYEEEDDR